MRWWWAYDGDGEGHYNCNYFRPHYSNSVGKTHHFCCCLFRSQSARVSLHCSGTFNVLALLRALTVSTFNNRSQTKCEWQSVHHRLTGSAYLKCETKIPQMCTKIARRKYKLHDSICVTSAFAFGVHQYGDDTLFILAYPLRGQNVIARPIWLLSRFSEVFENPSKSHLMYSFGGGSHGWHNFWRQRHWSEAFWIRFNNQTI